MTDRVIRTANLSKRFRRNYALDGLDLEVPAGSIYALVGPNGAGKTTTIKILMNIYPPTAGSSEVLGADSRRLSRSELARIGYVSENQQLPGWMPVGYFMEFLSNFYPTWDWSLAADLLRQFQLPPDRKLGHLSHGMRMKAALASALAYRPRLMVLDEPFTGLDALIRDELIEGVLGRATDATIFISSHDLTEIESFASHIGYLDRGRLQFSEGLESLAARFREIVLTFDVPPVMPTEWPDRWLLPETSGAVVRFVDSHFDEARTPAEVARVFGAMPALAASPMPLRAIFVALAKANRRPM
jgi:ABC-2 type transport system ATP-binding protein